MDLKIYGQWAGNVKDNLRHDLLQVAFAATQNVDDARLKGRGLFYKRDVRCMDKFGIASHKTLICSSQMAERGQCTTKRAQTSPTVTQE